MRMETGSPLSRLSSSLSIFHNANTLPFPMRCPLAERVVNTTVLRVVSSTSAPGRKHSKERTSGDNLSKTSSTGAKTGRLRSVTSGSRTGRFNGTSNKEKLNLEVSPHRAVSAVRLMRIQLGGAFADLLNEQGKGSGDNEMGYVERTLGFRTRDLDDRDLRLVTEIVGGTIRWRRYLDHLILSLCHDENTFRTMEPLLSQILRIGFYEIVKLEMPPYAVVDEIVIQAGLLKKGLCSVQDESAGTIYAIDVNKGRLRILKETAKLHEVNNVVTTIHADLRAFAEFCIDPVDKYVPCDFVTVDGFYSSNPVKHSLDGAFAARLLRSR
ncbi:UNVERIFIED_CONTAM: hypothetical protein Scaly_1248400 [Sesamum calycinum]|uniref:NusB/RsmB/TIM44 domain-containing protein n=1 Tax=Sesamum calycinum TaxID=2727403 RepID=A0AAW2Q573_9LAMI